jgi:hypothetical protein
MLGQFNILKPLSDSIKDVNRDTIFPCDTTWNEQEAYIEERREHLEGCLNDLEDQLEKLAVAYDRHYASTNDSMPTDLTESIDTIVKWLRDNK